MSRINISIPEEILNKLDAYKEIIKISRSRFILNSLENCLVEVKRKILDGKKKDAYDGILSLRIKAAPFFKDWDSTSEIRNLRDTRWAGDKK